VFAGTLGPSYDIRCIIECAKRCEKLGYYDLRFIIAGSGPFENEVRAAEEKLNNLIYVGKLLPKDLIPIYGKCDIGLSTYSAGSNVDMCDKFYDYTSAGLAIINSLKGEISEHITENKLGVNYEANNMESFMEALKYLRDSNVLNACKNNSWNAGMFFDKNRQNENLLKVISEILD